MSTILQESPAQETVVKSIKEIQVNLDKVQSSHKSEIGALQEQISHINQHLVELQEILKKDSSKINFPKLRIQLNWYKLFRTSHLYLGLGTSLLILGVCIVGIIVRHPSLFAVDASVSSLNSGIFIFGSTKVNFSPLLDFLALALIYLTISGFGMWAYPKLLKKRKEKEKQLQAAKKVKSQQTV